MNHVVRIMLMEVATGRMVFAAQEPCETAEPRAAIYKAADALVDAVLREALRTA